MSIRRSEDTSTPGWFFNDRPIRDAGQDLLNHQSIARVLKEAIESAEPPCMIGLLAEFGKGKSSTTNIAAEMLRGGSGYDVVTVTADKHSGNERARNLVHSIAAELARLPDIKRKAVTQKLHRLRRTTQIRSVDPTNTAARRLLSGEYSWLKLALSFLPFAAITVLIAALSLIPDEGWAADILRILAAQPLLAWLAAVLLLGPEAPMRSLHKPADVTEEVPRAEAADEIEEVFGELVDHHHEKTKRRLVVIVDDIDRLSSDDLLDALRVLRSLQSVPRGQEPVFVISCNEDILTTAVGKARSAPAPLPPGSRPSEADHDDPALAFIDKLLTVRVRMPPPIRGDMRHFAQSLIHSKHPLRKEADVDLDKIIPVLIHDEVDDPRTVVRLLNRFIGAYLLGCAREAERTVFPGDVTQHGDVLAQLCVLIDSFPDFHAEVVADPLLLLATRKVALHQTSLSASERTALVASEAFLEGDDGSLEFRDIALRRYMSATALRIRYPDDISPLVYMANTEAGKTLGRQLHSELRSGVTSGDHLVLAEVVAGITEDRLAAAGQAIADLLLEASPVDASTYITAVAPSLSAFDAAVAQTLADACVNLLDRSPETQLSAACLTEILTHVAEANDESLCRRLLVQCDDPTETNERHAHTAMYLADNPRIRPHVEHRLVEWLHRLPNEGSWEMGREWLDPAEALSALDHGELLRAAVTAMAKSIRSEQGFTGQDSNRLVRLADPVLRGRPEAAPSSDALVSAGPHTIATLVSLWQITDPDAQPEHCLFVAETSADTSVPTEARRLAVSLLADWTDVWESAEYEEDAEGSAEPIRINIVDWLVQAAQDPEVLAAVLDVLQVISEALDSETASTLLDAVTSIIERLLTEERIGEAIPAARSTIEAAGHDSDLLNRYARRLLHPINSESDPTGPTVRTSLELIKDVAATDNGEDVLSSIAVEWSEGLRQHGEYDARTRTRGFQALHEVLPRLVDENAESILHDLHQRIGSNDDPASRLRTVATFPWPVRLQSQAAGIVDEYWNSLTDETMPHAFALLARAEIDEHMQARFHTQLINATEADPYGSAAATAVRESGRMNPQHRRSLYVAAVGKHESATRMWADADDSEVADTLAVAARDADTARHLIEALPTARRAALAASALSRMVMRDAVADSVVDAIAAYSTPEGLQAAADTALAAIDDGTASLASGLRVLSTAKTRGATVATRRITAAAMTSLPRASVEAAELFGRMLRGVRIRGRLADVVKDMRHGQDAAREAAEAFTTERSSRR